VGLRAVLLDEPFTGAAELQSGAVHARSRHLKRLCSPGESGVVGNRQGETEKIDDRAVQSFGVARSELKQGQSLRTGHVQTFEAIITMGTDKTHNA